MNKHHSIHRNFLLKLTRDLFALSFVFWLILFVLEVLKKGIVSNYLSLPHFALLIAVVALLHLALKPADAVPQQKPSRAKPWKLNTILSVIITVLLVFTIDASFPLMALLIFVTVSTLWLVMGLLREGYD